VHSTADGQTLIYAAVSSIRFSKQGTVQRWSIFGLDLASGNISMIVPPLEGFNTGNPSLGRTNNRFLTLDAEEASSGNNAIIVADLFTGEVGAVGTVVGGVGYPCFTGNDSAVVSRAGVAYGMREHGR